MQLDVNDHRPVDEQLAELWELPLHLQARWWFQTYSRAADVWYRRHHMYLSRIDNMSRALTGETASRELHRPFDVNKYLKR